LFFFSSRRRHTRFSRDWSSDVCSSDLFLTLACSCRKERLSPVDNGYSSGEYQDTVNVNIDTNRFKIDYSKYTQARLFPGLIDARSEERRVGKESRVRRLAEYCRNKRRR